MLAFKNAKTTDFKVGLEMLKKAALYNQKKNIDHWLYWLKPPQYKIDWLVNGFKNQEFYFIYFDEARIGMFRLMNEDLLYWVSEENQAFYMHSLVILPEYRGQDYGKQTLELIERHCRQKEIYRFRLDCSANNKRLCKYYEDLRFQFVRKAKVNDQFYRLYEKLLNLKD